MKRKNPPYGNQQIHSKKGRFLFGKKAVSVVFASVIAFCAVCSFSVTARAEYENTYVNTGNQREDIIGVALTQLGSGDGSKYTFGRGNVSWCAYFVVWCARQAGIDSSIIALNGYATADDLGVEYRGRPADRSSEIDYTPQRGDLIFFDWESNGFCYKSPASFYGDHVGIVEYVSDGYVHTIEGNSSYREGSTGPETGLCVRKRVYALDCVDIKGYGIPAYQGEDIPTEETTAEIAAAYASVYCNEAQVLTLSGNNCGTYILRIYKDGVLAIAETVAQNTYYAVFSEPGEYSAYCTAYRSPTDQVTADSNWVTWEVKTALAPGDINGDNTVNNKDLTRLMKYLSGENVEVIAALLDVNGDGSVNNKDLTRLMKYLAGENVWISEGRI